MTATDIPKIIAKPSRFLLILMLIMGVVVIGLALIVYSFDKPTEQQAFATGLSIFMLCVGLNTLYNIRDLHILTLFTDRLSIKSVVGLTEREIYLSDITSWTEIKKIRGKSPRTFKHLTLYTDRGRYMISSEIYTDYNDLRQSLTQGKKRNLEVERKWHRRDNLKFSVYFLITGFLALYFAYEKYVQFDMIFAFVCIFGLTMIAASGYYYTKKI